jgi:3-oxoacyl-[acyl-carrier protein] reductase
MRLKNKNAIITGAGRGIGKEIACAFAKEGANVLIVDMESHYAEKTATYIRENNGLAEIVCANVADPTDVDKIFNIAGKYFKGSIDILVNNAGVAHHCAFLELSLDDWDRLISNNLTSVFLCSQKAAQSMAEVGSGTIINIGSISAQRGSFGRTAYGVAKAGVHQLSRIMSVELGMMGITVNTIAPGPIDTGITKFGPDQKRRYLERIPSDRFGLAGDIAGVAVFLASSDAAFMNGSVVNVDGGFDAAGLMFSYEELTTVKSDIRENTD